MILEIDSREYTRRLLKRFKAEVGFDRLSKSDQQKMGDGFIDSWQASETADPKEFAEDIINQAVNGTIASAGVAIDIARAEVGDLAARNNKK